jgi:LPS sulfotransferase NodH
MLKAGTNDTGIFGIRIMWSSVAEATRRLGRVNGGPLDAQAQLETAFGPVLYVHLSRNDKVAQTISLVRAEQSGLWHLAADGSVFEGAAVPQPNVYDGQRIAEVFTELHNDDIAWESFFATHGIEPLRLTYEGVTADPQAGLASVLAALGRDPEVAKAVSVGTRKMGSGESLDWAKRFRSESGLPPV